MSIIYTYQKSPKRKPTAKQRQLQQAWEELVEKFKPKKVVVSAKPLPSPKRYIRETPSFPSLDSGGGVGTKPVYDKVYTGDKMKGIGTLHKSNAVPIFTDEEAVDQANMRR